VLSGDFFRLGDNMNPKVGEIWISLDKWMWFITKVEKDEVFSYPLQYPNNGCWRGTKWFMKIFKRLQ